MRFKRFLGQVVYDLHMTWTKLTQMCGKIYLKGTIMYTSCLKSLSVSVATKNLDLGSLRGENTDISAPSCDHFCKRIGVKIHTKEPYTKFSRYNRHSLVSEIIVTLELLYSFHC